MFKFLKSSITKVSKALSRTASYFTSRLSSIFSKPLDEERLDMLEEILYEADLGSSVVDHFIENISSFAKKNPNTSKDQYLDQLEKIALEIFTHATPTIKITLGEVVVSFSCGGVA